MKKASTIFAIVVLLVIGFRPNLYVGENAGIVLSFPFGHCGGYEFAGHPGFFWDVDCL